MRRGCDGADDGADDGVRERGLDLLLIAPLLSHEDAVQTALDTIKYLPAIQVDARF
ncbi:hypothetical protein GCM10027157_11840 [Corynebacterium aquatimens]